MSKLLGRMVALGTAASLGILTAGVAHEINNPINYISNGAELIENYINEHCTQQKEDLEPYFEAINEGVDRTVNIVRSLGRYSRCESLPWSQCNLHEVIEDCLVMLFNQYKNNIEIHKDFDNQLPTVYGNEGQIHQLIMNLLLNAVHAIKEEGDIYIVTKKNAAEATITIKDNGEGIKKNDLKHIFDPFFTTKDPGMGTGLGLSISQKIVHEHGGTIFCDSEYNKGTMFVINLPVKNTTYE